MSDWPASTSARAAGFRTLWRARPIQHTRAYWALSLGLDVLPWPWGAAVLTRLFMLAGMLQAPRRRAALAWAAQQPGHRRWRLAAALCAFRGRRFASGGLIGLRGPDDLRRHIVVEGAEHLEGAPGGTILLGFHLGPGGADVALRACGHPMAWLGGPRGSRALSRGTWRRFLDPAEHLAPIPGRMFWPGLVLRARRMLLEGGRVFVMADCGVGREAFRVTLPGGDAVMRQGWLALQRQTGARVLPVLSHREGRRVVITVHPALPAKPGDQDGELAAWRDILGSLLRDYVRRFPEQCTGLVFQSLGRARW